MFQRVEGDPVVSPDGSVRLRARLGACVERTLPAYAQNPVKFGDASNYLHFQTSWRKFRSDTYYLQIFVLKFSGRQSAPRKSTLFWFRNRVANCPSGEGVRNVVNKDADYISTPF